MTDPAYTLDTHIRKQRMDMDNMLATQQSLAYKLKEVTQHISNISDDIYEGYRNLRELEYHLKKEQTLALKEARDE